MQTVTPIQLALQHHKAGRLQQAEQMYRHILSYDEDNADANHYLGIIACQRGENDIAIQLINKAIQANPNIPATYSNLGNALKRLGRLEEAVENYRKAISLDPNSAIIYCNLGAALKDLSRTDKAIASYKKAISIKPDFAEAHCNFGLTFKEVGLIKEAIASYKNAITSNSNHAKAHHYLSHAIKHHEYDDTIHAMETFYNRSDIDVEQKMHLAFGLGIAFENLNEHKKSFVYISEGNRLKRASYQYTIEEDIKFFDKIKKVFSLSFLSSHSNSGNEDETPLFILGMPRSGTTLVEQILASHSQVFGAGELNHLPNIAISSRSKKTNNKFPEYASKLNNDSFYELGSKYIENLRRHSTTDKFITDKMPNNFVMIGLIKTILPQAKVIHCMRDPMDNCYSIFKNFFAGNQKYAYDMKELGLYYNLYLDLMDHWRKVIPDFIYDIRYEELVSDQENQTRKLLNYCKLPWEESCLSFHKTDRRVGTASAIQVRRPIYTDSIQLWKKFESQLGPLKKALLV